MMNLAIVGLGVMGRNLALNFQDAGYRLAAWDPWPDARDWQADSVKVCSGLGDLKQLLAPPRIVLLMVKAGEPVRDLARQLADVLEPGDIVIDGGNAHFADTAANANFLHRHGIHFAGLGISGGAEGARHGPSMMLGCPEALRPVLEPLLSTIAAQHEDRPCLGWFGPDGAGHFVKMVHNGIEYAVMEAIAECWQLLEAAGTDASSAGAILGDWAQGELAGYLMEISSEVLQVSDPASGDPLVTVIDDAAGQKGTGNWCAAAALELGVPVPSIAAAVSLRQISSHPDLRRCSTATGKDTFAPPSADDLKSALSATIALSLMQGAHLLAAGNEAHGWRIDAAEAARVWRAGSILRMALLDRFADRTALLDFAVQNAAGLRRSVAAAALAGVPHPVLSSSLGYLDALCAATLPTALIQLQRDRFGAHGLAHKETGAAFHGPWRKGEP